MAAPLCPVKVLAENPSPELRRLVVTTTTEEVLITGRVSSYYLKQMAQEAVKPAVGGRKLLNRVLVAARPAAFAMA